MMMMMMSDAAADAADADLCDPTVISKICDGWSTTNWFEARSRLEPTQEMENPPEHRNPTTCDKWWFQVQLQRSTLRGAVALLFELIPMRVFPRLTFFKSHLDDLFLRLLRQNSDELKRFCDCFTATL